MNIKVLQDLISGPYPVELAYGFTFDRESLHIIMYADKISRIIEKRDDRIERIDQTDNLQVWELVNPHKRFYPNRVNPIFEDLCKTFGLQLSITTVDESSSPRFDFPEN
jgi:hypothetical protein